MILRRTALLSILTCVMLCGCAAQEGDPALSANVQTQLMDWHISGFWVINCPVAWVKVTNYNAVAVKDPLIEYTTYDADGNKLDLGTYQIEGTIAPGQVKNFIELYLGLVSLYSDRLSVRLLSVSRE